MQLLQGNAAAGTSCLHGFFLDGIQQPLFQSCQPLHHHNPVRFQKSTQHKYSTFLYTSAGSLIIMPWHPAAPSVNLDLSSNLNPIPPPSQDEHEWLTTYLLIHRLSFPSYRYTYLLWIAVVIVFLASVILHWYGRVCGSFVSALWKKWGYRQRTWRKKHSLAQAKRKNRPHKQPLPLPSNAQLLGLLVLFVLSFVLSFVGPDYIAPGTHIWDLFHNTTQPNMSSSSTFSSTPPSFTIYKTWWSSGGRTGIIAFALFPLCVLFALKAPPFAVFALPFLIQLYSDKLAFLHRWSGRLIWLVTTLHVALWTVQLCRDTIEPGTPIFTVAFTYEKFVFGWLVGSTCTTLHV